MSKFLCACLAWIAAMAISSATLAMQPDGADAAVSQHLLKDAEFKALLAQRLGGSAEDYSFQPLPGSGLVQVYSRANARIAYVDPAVKYVFVGTLYDASDKRNLTAEQEHQLNRIPLDTLPTSRIIRVVKGKGTPRFAAFEDPDCPFCRAMEQKLDELPDYTLDVLLLPLTELHPKAEAAAKAIWCAPDPSRAWVAYMHTGQLPDGGAQAAASADSCHAPLKELAELARLHHIRATPTLLMPDGEIIEGMPDLDTLKARQ